MMPAALRSRSAFSRAEVFVFMVDKVQTGCDRFGAERRDAILDP